METKTLFGAKKVDNPTLYNGLKLRNKILVKVDGFRTLHEIFGQKLVEEIDRDILHMFLAGELNESTTQSMLVSLCKTYFEFNYYITELLLYKEPYDSDVRAIFKPIREFLDKEEALIIEELLCKDGKYAFTHGSIIYGAVGEDIEINTIKGVMPE